MRGSGNHPKQPRLSIQKDATSCEWSLGRIPVVRVPVIIWERVGAHIEYLAMFTALCARGEVGLVEHPGGGFDILI